MHSLLSYFVLSVVLLLGGWKCEDQLHSDETTVLRSFGVDWCGRIDVGVIQRQAEVGSNKTFV